MNGSDASDGSTFDKGGRTGFLLIHGLGGTPAELRFVARGLARSGYTVYCCQLAGHGQSYEALRVSTWRQWAASAEAAVDRLRQHCDVVIAGGLSTGALLSLLLAAEQPQKVDGLVLYSPSLRLDGWAMPWYMSLLHMIRPTPIRCEIRLPECEPYGLKDERVRQLVVQAMLSGDPRQAGYWGTPLRTLAHFNSLSALVDRSLGKIKTPTLIMHPREDDMASIDNAFRIQRKLAGLAELVVLDDCYHIITLDRQRQVVVDRTAAFAAQLERRLLDARRPAAESGQSASEKSSLARSVRLAAGRGS